ncbi:DUF6069 family protein [Deinococcus cellulosilyticus]|uniref:Uncharacterized protein n=1 Tax=Deinococcus cellulosilyticus (strain DSM 18568 / NBRC 106333 / KACC 11606 / 5516J-15) TaxID=1223518 RepID=A0A511NBK4_DEIC1|nr:DUF6069 family protein [Deinococcus cellulosilyticus]GEM50190.1 hypothetical protein DC3_58250 [Deinococcus cellulosilyticus NBRC 106333 = KACC 11606]
MTTQNLIRKTTQAALIATVLNVLLFFIAKAAGVQLQVTQGPNSTTLMDLPVIAVILATVIPAYFAAGVYALLQRAGNTGTVIFQVVGWVFLALSMFPVMGLPGDLSLKLVLALMHIIAGVTILTSLNAGSQTQPAVVRN